MGGEMESLLINMKPTFEVFDERGIPVEDFDIIKVYHYQAARRREHKYMYKQARVAVSMYDGKPYIFMHHLMSKPFNPMKPYENTYNVRGRMEGARIVQSSNFEKLR